MHVLLLSGEDDQSINDELRSPSRKKARLSLEVADDEPGTSGSVADSEGGDVGSDPQNPQLCRSDEVPPTRSLFYLTKVRGIAERYNQSNVAVGIRGDHHSSR